MKERIPQRVDYHRYTEQGVTLDGLITKADSLKDMSRFNESIVDILDDISYHLAFDTDLLGNRFVTGSVETQVQLQCQRCMGNFSLSIKSDITIAFVKNESEQSLAEDSNYDVFWLKTKELFDPRVLLEDELLLSLPQIPMHPESEIGQDCDVQVQFLDEEEHMTDAGSSESHSSGDSLEKELEQKDDNPFAILKQLKNK
ncbi:MAG: hypothetical protein GY694_14355 [Gammaproteobacteria bacterium]|nr:hypothetical protein [Gammaproteobacteria bacterium]